MEASVLLAHITWEAINTGLLPLNIMQKNKLPADMN